MISKIYSMLKNAFRIAQQKQIIVVNIMDDNSLRQPKSDKADKKVRGMTDEEQKRFIKEGTKTVSGKREIPISKPLEKVLKQALDEMKDNPDGLIFYDHRKQCVISTTQVNSAFKTICTKAGAECNGQHSLRHTFATRCIEAGIPALVLKGWLGHKNIYVTLDTYADVFSRMEFGEMAKFDSYIDTVMR